MKSICLRLFALLLVSSFGSTLLISGVGSTLLIGGVGSTLLIGGVGSTLLISGCASTEKKAEEPNGQYAVDEDKGELGESNDPSEATNTETPKVDANSVTLRGQVFNEKSKQPIKGAVLYLLLGDEKIAEANSDDLGRFEIVEPLKPGRYIIKVISSRFHGVLSFQVKGKLIEGIKVFAAPK